MNWLQDIWGRISQPVPEDPDARGTRPAHLRALVIGLMLAAVAVLVIALVVALA
jgi:hypothetical protein